MSSPADDFLFAGTHGHVIAVDKVDGETIWETSLPKTGYGVVVLLVEDDRLLCASAGRLFALDPVNGQILWSNDLPGKGLGIVAITTMKHGADAGSAMAALAAAQAQSDAAAGSTT